MSLWLHYFGFSVSVSVDRRSGQLVKEIHHVTAVLAVKRCGNLKPCLHSLTRPQTILVTTCALTT